MGVSSDILVCQNIVMLLRALSKRTSYKVTDTKVKKCFD
jgi:hypothetical protein